MLTEERLKPTLTDVNLNTGSVSVALDVLIKRNAEVISRGRDRRAFNAGELEQYKEYVGYTEGLDVKSLAALWDGFPKVEVA